MKLYFSSQSSNLDKRKPQSKQKRSPGMFIHSLILISETKICIVNLIALFVSPWDEQPFLCKAF